MPRHLVIVRAGDQSLHERWSTTSGSYDLAVSYYGDDPRRFRAGAILRHDSKGGKLEGVHRLLTDHPLLLDAYDYVWMPDDDILVDAKSLEYLFAEMRTYDLAVAQPALDGQSHVSLRITAKHEGFRLRFTNFVEVMAPCFNAGFLRELVPLFKGKRFGWGLDWYWARQRPPHARTVAIIDACTMTHTRPQRTGELYATGSPTLELKAFLKEVRWPALPRPGVIGAILETGELLERGNPALSRNVRVAQARVRMSPR